MKKMMICPNCGTTESDFVEVEQEYRGSLQEVDDKMEITDNGFLLKEKNDTCNNGAPLHIITRALERLKEETGYGINSKVEEIQRKEASEPCERPPEADFSRTPRNGYQISNNGYDGRGYCVES